jgi:hypothetical protein
MSKTQDKKVQRKIEHAEFLWNQAQLQSALIKNQLDLAVQTFKELSGEMTEEQINVLKST